MTARVGAVPTLLLLLALVPVAQGQGEPPVVDFGYQPSEPFAADPVRFTDLSTDPDGTVVSRLWRFGDGNTSTEANPLHRFREPGLYNVSLTVTDNDGNQREAHTDLRVSPAPLQTFPTWMYWIMPAFVGTILLGLGLLVLLKGQPNIYNRVFFLLTTASSLKSYTDSALFFLLDVAPNSGALQPFAYANRLIAFLYGPIFLWFVLVFPRPVRPWLKDGRRGAWTLLLAVPFTVSLVFDLLPSDTFQNAFNIYVSLLALAALGLLVYHAWETDSEEERHRLRLLATTFFLLVFSTIMVSLLQLAASVSASNNDFGAQQTYQALGDAFGTIVSGILEIIGFILVMYAILRYQLLGSEVLIKRVTRTAMFAFTMAVTFVTVGNTVEFFFEEKILQGRVPLGFLVAGFVAALAMYPIQKLTEKIATRMFPEAGSKAPDHLAARRMEIYEAQLRYALLDGQLKEKELTMLHALRDSLGLKPTELVTVAKKFPGLDTTPLQAALARPTASP